MRKESKIAIVIVVIMLLVNHFSSYKPKERKNQDYAKLDARNHESNIMDKAGLHANIVGKSISLNSSDEDWNLKYDVLYKNNNEIKINDDGQVTVTLERFKYADYDSDNKCEIKSSINNNDIEFLSFNFDNGDNFSYDKATLNRGKYEGWNESINRIEGIETSVAIHKITTDYSVYFDYGNFVDLQTCKTLKIMIHYTNGKDEMRVIDLKGYQAYLAYNQKGIKID